MKRWPQDSWSETSFRMSNAPHEHDAWTDCPPGAIARSADRLCSHRRRRRTRRIAAALAILLAVPLTAWSVGLIGGRPAAARDRLTCRDVKELSHDYLAGGLDVHLRELFDRHLHRCPKCRKWLDQHGSAVLTPPAAARIPPAAVVKHGSRRESEGSPVPSLLAFTN